MMPWVRNEYRLTNVLHYSASAPGGASISNFYQKLNSDGRCCKSSGLKSSQILIIHLTTPTHMRTLLQYFSIFLLLSLFIYTGCTTPDSGDRAVMDLQNGEGGESPYVDELNPSTLLKNGFVWDGLRENDFQRAHLIIRDGVIQEIYDGDDHEIPETDLTIDLDGSYLIPGLINAHGHVGVAHGLQPGPPASTEESLENVLSQLELYARYGVTTVISLGDEPSETFQVRDNPAFEDEAISRLFLAGKVLSANTPEEADSLTLAHLDQNPDWLKIRVDDGLGTHEKLPEEVYARIIETGRDHGVPLAAHIVTLVDAKAVIRNDAEIIGHSIRDQSVDQELIDLMLENDICITPTLTRELSTFVYASEPDFFEDPFFLKYADSESVEQLKREEVQQQFTGREADYYREALPVAKENLLRLHEAGVPVAMGTDSGPPGRFQGYFEHLELQMMKDSGMSVKEILVSSTSLAAECMNIDEITGTVEKGKKADFLILEENPLESLDNLREIRAVYIGGRPVDLEP